MVSIFTQARAPKTNCEGSQSGIHLWLGRPKSAPSGKSSPKSITM